MNVNKRDRGDLGTGRETVQRAPRSGGRTAAQWAPAEGAPRSGGQEAIVRGIGAGRRAERLNGARGRGAAAPSTPDRDVADQGGSQRIERLSSLERIERREREAAAEAAAPSTIDRPARRTRDERAERPARDDRAARDLRAERPSRDERVARDLRAERSPRDERATGDPRAERPSRDKRAAGDLRADRDERPARDERATSELRADRAAGRNAGGSRTSGSRTSGTRGQAARAQAPRDPAGAPARRGTRAVSSSEPVDLSAARGRRFDTEGSAALQPEEIHVLVEPAEPVHEEPPAPRLRVTPPRPVAVPRAPFIAGILVTVVAGVVGILLINTQTNQNAFRLDELQKQQAALDVQQQELEKQIEEYESPNYLIAHAKKLGLVQAEEPAFIELPNGKIIGVPKPAGGEPAITSQESGR
ncbi:hypothetical protein J2S43_000477 [Catenuloplanes nepalensis]|uniref:Septum formation initiator n=1 Tax=Catenuloplanes nepalensis TaxID=587533 RepID=A0ABT9MKM0_9ACTN|nr:hypothetical protein [Catenuloplanes nepalensis]MDP9791965.1 hypothetical protein [Catenuloplanes nepalensis]